MPRYAPNMLPATATAQSKQNDVAGIAVQLGQKLQYEYGMECARRYAAAMRGVLPEEHCLTLCKSLGIAPDSCRPEPPKPPPPTPPTPPCPPNTNPQAMLIQMLMQMFMGSQMGQSGSNGASPMNPAFLMQMLSNSK